MFFFDMEWISPTLKSVPVDVIVTSLQKYCMPLVQIFILAVMYIGAIRPFYTRTWKKSPIDIFMSFAKIGGAIIGTIMYFGLWKSNTWLWRGDIGPFLFNKLAIPVGLVIPIGSAFLAFLASYGLMEFIGVLVDCIDHYQRGLSGEPVYGPGSGHHRYRFFHGICDISSGGSADSGAYGHVVHLFLCFHGGDVHRDCHYRPAVAPAVHPQHLLWRQGCH